MGDDETVHELFDLEDAPELREVKQYIFDTAPKLASDFLRRGQETRLDRASKDASVAEDIAHVWARGWTVLDAVINAMEQSCALMFAHSEIEDDHADVREALLLLQSAATLTLREIAELVRAGYLSGAAARWRALHETAVTAVLVAEGGPSIARRYVDHGVATQLLRLEAFYQQPHPEAPPAAERAERMRLVDELVAKHTLPGETVSFRRPYAWATPLMPTRAKDGKHMEPNFARMEAVAGQLDMRLLVQHGAHGHVHNDAGAVRTAVLKDGSLLVVGPRSDEAQTVAIPALRTVVVIAAATHLGFEPQMDHFGRLISVTGAAIANLAATGVEEFRSVHRSAQMLF